MSEVEQELVFVYGTLRRGGGKETLLRGSRFLRETTLPGTLHDLGSYPALVLGDGGVVHGEVWSCPAETLRSIDSYEGLSEGLFERVLVTLEAGFPCWVYVAGPGVRRRLAPDSRIASGRWPPVASDSREGWARREAR